MVNYKEYLSAVEAAFNEYKALQERRSSDAVARFSAQERELRQQYERKKAVLQTELSEKLKKIDRSLMTVRQEGGSRKKALSDEMAELTVKEHAIGTEYNELCDLAREASDKRAKIRSRLFRFWWNND